jgi:hypothetical protein
LIIVSCTLVEDSEAIAGTDICDSSLDRGHSDHVPLWTSLSLPKLMERPGSAESG